MFKIKEIIIRCTFTLYVWGYHYIKIYFDSPHHSWVVDEKFNNNQFLF